MPYLKYAAFVNALLHCVQGRGLSPVWVLMRNIYCKKKAVQMLNSLSWSNSSFANITLMVVSAQISSTAEWVITQWSTILLSSTLGEHLSFQTACLMMCNYTGCFCLDFSPLCLQMSIWEWPFQIARLRGYIFTLAAFVWIFFTVFSVFKWLEDTLSHWLHLFAFSTLCLLKLSGTENA